MERARTIGGGLFGAGLRAFMKQRGLPPVSSRASQYVITAEQRELARRGDAEAFWRSRAAIGDPIARHGLASLHPRPKDPTDALFGGAAINRRLQGFHADRSRPQDLERIRRDLMQAHISAVDADRQGVPGLLDPQQVARYHHEVFGRHQLPPRAFGGSPLTGHPGEADATSVVWCRGCDW